MGTAQEQRNQEFRKYLDLRLNEFKLKTVDGLSVGVSRVLSLMAAIMMGAIALAAFAFARLDFKGKNAAFTLLLALMMIPNELVIITNFQKRR